MVRLVPNHSEWVASLALALSVVSLGWQVVRARRHRPIITVDGQCGVERRKLDGLWEEPHWTLPVKVTNAGGRAVTVTKVGWELFNRDSRRTLVHSAKIGVDLPTRLEAHSQQSWEARMPVRGADWAGRLARPVAYVVLGKRPVAVHGSSTVLSVPDMEPPQT
jgi:hypothetical protein